MELQGWSAFLSFSPSLIDIQPTFMISRAMRVLCLISNLSSNTNTMLDLPIFILLSNLSSTSISDHRTALPTQVFHSSYSSFINCNPNPSPRYLQNITLLTTPRPSPNNLRTRPLPHSKPHHNIKKRTTPRLYRSLLILLTANCLRSIKAICKNPPPQHIRIHILPTIHQLIRQFPNPRKSNRTPAQPGRFVHEAVLDEMVGVADYAFGVRCDVDVAFGGELETYGAAWVGEENMC